MTDLDSTERWLQIPDFPDYQVSSFGRVCSLKQDAPRLLKPITTTYGYAIVSLHQGGRTQRYVHRLVLEAFVGECPDGCEAAHLDGNQVNNALDNLAWVTPKENQGHRRIHGTAPKGEQNGRSKLTGDRARQIRHLRSMGVMPTALGRRFGVSRHQIYKVLWGKAWKDV